MKITTCITVASLFITTSLWADIPPPDHCSIESAGQACDNASSDDGAKKAGVCEKSTCSRRGPTGVVQYECGKCVAKEGAAPAPTAPAEPAPSPAPAPPAEAAAEKPSEPALPKPVSDTPAAPAAKGGCSVDATRSPAQGLFILGLLVGFSALFRRKLAR